jgi:serine/threonine protein kinase
LRTVLRSRLLDRAQLQEALRGVPPAQRQDPQALADYLVKAGKLSRFQAGKLLQGTALGLVLGPYQVLAPVGKGGMGAVYLARDERSGQLLALKVLPPRTARTEERQLARFRREMEMSRLVAHPHLAWTYEVGEHHGAHYIAMEFIPGKTLARLVADEGPLQLARAARLLAEVAAGLEHAHRQGLVHRDLKPSNIQVTPHDHAKVLDLGLALMAGDTADARVIGGRGYILGTMDYIAPEQTADASRVDARSDLYSLGCTLYFALSGQPPFPGGSSRDKIRRHRHDRPAPLADLRPGLPPAFVALVERLLAKPPEQRPATAAEVECDLRAWASGAPVLPLDVPGDDSYVRSVASLQAAGSSEHSDEGLTFLEEATDEAKAGEVEPPPLAEAKTLPAWLVLLVLGGVGLLGAGGLLLALAAWLLWR